MLSQTTKVRKIAPFRVKARPLPRIIIEWWLERAMEMGADEAAVRGDVKMILMPKTELLPIRKKLGFI